MNFKHLYYFWVAAKAGGVLRAGAQLHITPQTLSSQIKLLEERLGRELFRKSGRKLEPVSYTHLDVYKRQLYVLHIETGKYIDTVLQ